MSKKVKKPKQSEQAEADQQQHSDAEFSTDWDLESYRRDYESEEHWLLRKRFMEVHKDKFPEDKLVCLAQVFTNMEFMGCKYPSKTMIMVGELSQEVAKEFRAGRANRLKRTFVAASDAAEARAKGRRSAQPPSVHQHGIKRKHFDEDGGSCSQQQSSANKQSELSNLFAGLKYNNFILYLHGGRSCLKLSAQRCNVIYSEKDVGENNSIKIDVYIDNKYVASGSAENVKLCKAAAFDNALETLQKHCYTIKQNPFRNTIKIGKDNNKVVGEVIKTQCDADVEDKKIDASNKGYKMMKMMGWSGGGLGSQKQGREDPVGYLFKSDRAGLGNENSKLDRKYFKRILRNYVESEDIRELQFEPTFTKDERALLHEIAKSLNLKSTSYGQGEQRRLIVNKKTITDLQILQEVLIFKNSRYIDRYLVQVPESKRAEFPEHTLHLTL